MLSDPPPYAYTLPSLFCTFARRSRLPLTALGEPPSVDCARKCHELREQDDDFATFHHQEPIPRGEQAVHGEKQRGSTWGKLVPSAVTQASPVLLTNARRLHG